MTGRQSDDLQSDIRSPYSSLAMNRSELEPHRIVRLEGDAVVLLDQRRLPDEEVELRCATAPSSPRRSACSPSAARPRSGSRPRTGMALAAERGEDLELAFETLAASRPTAVNLRWALEAMRDEPTRERAEAHPRGRGRAVSPHGRARRRAVPGGGAGAHALQRGRPRDGRLRHGARRDPGRRGGGARRRTSGSDETRPLLQGSRLTAWELEQLGIAHTVIADAAAASFMARGEVDLVVTGADRIAANGDVANKIGTYGLAVLAAHHGLPLVVVAPTSTLDPSLRDGRRDPDRGARSAGGDDAVPGPEPRVRRHAGGASSTRSSPSTACTGHRTPRPAAGRRGRSMTGDDARRGDERAARAVRVRQRALRGAPRPGRRRRAVGRVQRRRRRRSSRPTTTTSSRCPRPARRELAGRARQPGLEALAAGRVAQVVLAGGMATRFGGVVKGVVEALDGRSFLSWKLGETARLGERARRRDPRRADDELRHRRRERAPTSRRSACPSRCGSRSASRSGSPRRASSSTRTGAPSPYAPGPRRPARGDPSVGDARRPPRPWRGARRGLERRQPRRASRSGGRRHARAVGPRDDLRGRAQGGRHGRRAGARGRPRRAARGARVPARTSTTTGSPSSTRTRRPSTLDALDRDFDLRWLYVRKSVAGRDAIQLEHLYHHASWELADGISRGASHRPARQVLPDQGAADLERSRGDAARDARRVRPGLSSSPARSRHEVGAAPVTARRLPSRHGSRSASLLPSRCAGCDVPGPSLCASVDARSSGSPRPSASGAGVPGAWPVRRCVECIGRRLGFVRARGSARVRRPGATARLRLEGAWATRSRRCAGLARRRGRSPARASAASRSCPGDRERGRERGHVPAAAPRGSARRALGAPGGAPARAHVVGAAGRPGCRALSAWRTSAAAFRASECRRRRTSRSSTTSTRRARPPRPVLGCSVVRGRAASRWFASHGRCDSVRVDREQEALCDSRSRCGTGT